MDSTTDCHSKIDRVVETRSLRAAGTADGTAPGLLTKNQPLNDACSVKSTQKLQKHNSGIWGMLRVYFDLLARL